MPPAAPDYYALLHVDPSATADEIKSAYLQQVLRWHPDRNPSDEATQRTAQLNAAWETLKDAGTRASYDRRRAHRPVTSRPRAAGPDRPPPPPRPRPTTIDPVAAERARRAAEASAREAEARRTREAEYERRRSASEQLWEPPPASGLSWTDRDFVVGHWYRDQRGPYRVVDLREKWVDVYYPGGEIVTHRREDLWRLWQRESDRGRSASRPRRNASRRY